jgi:hypothetical protein
MTEKSFGQELGGELAGKAIIWGPSIAGAILLGPVGFLLGVAASVAILASDSGSGPKPGGDRNQPGS